MKSIPELSIDARLLIDLLSKVGIGETVGYDTLSEAIGRDVRGTAYSQLATARRHLLRDKQMVFEAVHNVGIKRLSDAEIVATGESAVGRVRRAARRGTQRLTSVQDFDALPNALKLKHNAYLSTLGAIGMLAKGSAVKKVEEAVSASSGALPIGRTLELFR